MRNLVCSVVCHWKHILLDIRHNNNKNNNDNGDDDNNIFLHVTTYCAHFYSCQVYLQVLCFYTDVNGHINLKPVKTQLSKCYKGIAGACKFRAQGLWWDHVQLSKQPTTLQKVIHFPGLFMLHAILPIRQHGSLVSFWSGRGESCAKNAVSTQHDFACHVNVKSAYICLPKQSP